jgi:TonB family C-terminal domain
MGKILKYCGSCEEGFAERFTFCPVCGASLQAVQLNPVADEVKSESVEPVAPAFIAADAEPETITAPFTSEPESAQEYPLEAAPITETFSPEVADEVSASYATGPLETPEEIQPAVKETYYTAPAMHADEPRKTVPAQIVERADDGGFYVTVIEEKNSKQRNILLLGATGFILVAAMVLTVVSLFSKDLNVGSIDDNPLFSAVLFDEIPMVVEEEEEQKQADDKDGGGGGGGKNEQTPASRGDLPDMTRNPSRPPDVNTPRFENPSLPIPPPQIQGPEMKTPKEYGKWGVPNGLDGPPSNGPGSGGGIGSGNGPGVGSGNGTGAGSGNGSGLGSGNGDGIGGGSGAGGAPPAIKAAVTENFRITSKPQARYTDAGRTNSVQGTVRLKVTLLASGAVGSITPVTRLPHGMTEQAIAAARLIKFTPKKVNGQAQSVIVTVEYNFNLY